MEAAEQKQASDILLLDTRKVCSFADYFVICSGESGRQLEAIAEEVEKTLKANSLFPRGREGDPSSGWILLDYTDVIVHVFSLLQREYYNLEELWSQANTIVHIQ